MKIKMAILWILTVIAAMYGGYQHGASRNDEYNLLYHQQFFPQYSSKVPQSTNTVFQQAYQELSRIAVIEGAAVGPTGECGTFHRLFAPIYEHGTLEDFETMANFAGPVVRAMGLLCLKYRGSYKALDIALRSGNDNFEVETRSSGCMYFPLRYSAIAIQEIMGSEDFMNTRSIAQSIDARRIKEEYAIAVTNIQERVFEPADEKDPDQLFLIFTLPGTIQGQRDADKARMSARADIVTLNAKEALTALSEYGDRDVLVSFFCSYDYGDRVIPPERGLWLEYGSYSRFTRADLESLVSLPADEARKKAADSKWYSRHRPRPKQVPTKDAPGTTGTQGTPGTQK